MKGIHAFTLLLMSGVLSSCGQNQTNVPKDSTRSETKDTATSEVPNSMVRHVRQARNGDILVASYKGVFRYDGKSFTNLTVEIESPSFWDVLEDRKGNLWFASKDSGVYRFDGKSFQHFTTGEGLANNRVGSIYEDKAGNIWFATGGGASVYDGRSFRNFTTKEGLSNNDLTIIMEDKTGKLWFGTRGEACFYDGKTFTVFKNGAGKSFNNVWSIIEDRKGNIWFGGSIIKGKKGDTVVAEDGHWRYDGSTFTKASPRGAYAIIEDKKGNIWTTGIVNPPNGRAWALSRYDQKSLDDEKPSVTEIMSIEGTGALLGILEANDGSIWFGSLGTGSFVRRYDGKTIIEFNNKKDKP